MTRRLVDEREVVAVVLNFRSLDGLEAEQSEDPPHLASGKRDRAQAASAKWRSGSGEVERLSLDAPGPVCLLDGALALAEGVGHPLDELVDHLAHLPAGFRVRDLAEAPPVPGQLPVVPTEIPGPHGVERGRILRRNDCLKSLGRDAMNVGGHALVRAPRATSTSC